MTGIWKQEIVPHLSVARFLGIWADMLVLFVVCIGSLLNARTRMIEAHFESLERLISESKESIGLRCSE